MYELKTLVYIITIDQSMLNTKTIVVYSENHTKHIHTRCGQKVEFWFVKTVGTQSNHQALQDKRHLNCVPTAQNTHYLSTQKTEAPIQGILLVYFKDHPERMECELKAVFYELGGVHNNCEVQKNKAIILNMYSPIRCVQFRT